MKILFIGDLNEYGRCFQRYKTLIELGNELKGLYMVSVPFIPWIDNCGGFIFLKASIPF